MLSAAFSLSHSTHSKAYAPSAEPDGPDRYIFRTGPRAWQRGRDQRKETRHLITIVARTQGTASRLRQRLTAAARGVAFALVGVASAFAQNGKLAPRPIADYQNKYEGYGGLSFLNFQAGQNLPKRMNLGGGEVMGTWWVLDRLGVAADYRIEAGTTPVLPVHGFNRVLVTQNIGMAGVQYRGPKGRYAAVDYHALGGVSHGTFDSAIKNYPGGTPYTTADLGLYSNRTKPFYALGGSIDFNYSRKIAIRVQPDLILEHFGTELREFVSVSGGVVYRFGRR